MRLATFTLIGALAVSARAAPLAPSLDVDRSPGIVQVWGGCGPGGHPVPAHWSRWRGGWVPPHCAPNYRPYGYYGGGYGGGYPYWQHRYYRWGY